MSSARPAASGCRRRATVATAPADHAGGRAWRRSPVGVERLDARACSSAREPDAVTHHSRVPASGAACGRQAEVAVARRVAPDEVPGADGDGRVDDQQLAVRGVPLPTPATRHSPPAAISARAVAALPSETCASSTRRTRTPRSRRADQRPSIRRTDLVDRGVDAYDGRRAATAISRSPRHPGRARTSARHAARTACRRRHSSNARSVARPHDARCARRARCYAVAVTPAVAGPTLARAAAIPRGAA